jgi:hypothetical protein
MKAEDVFKVFEEKMNDYVEIKFPYEQQGVNPDEVKEIQVAKDAYDAAWDACVNLFKEAIK